MYIGFQQTNAVKSYLLETRIKKLYRSVIGHHSEFTLENRMFNMINIIAIVAVAIALPMNYMLGYPTWILVLTASILGLQAYLYYLSRVRKRFYLSRILVAILSYSFLTLHFFYNSGLDGPTLLCFCFLYTSRFV